MTNVDTVCFLDLEQTIISIWTDPVLCNVGKIRSFLEENDIKTVGIFSFAIYNYNDQVIFEREIKPMIERALGVTVLTWPSVQDQVKADQEFTGRRSYSDFEIHDFIAYRGKQDAFRNYVLSKLSKYQFRRAILIDDVVPDQTIVDRRNNWAIEYYNVDRL